MGDWELLNRAGRIGLRRMYRRMRRLDVPRSLARRTVCDVLLGVSMTPYWTEGK